MQSATEPPTASNAAAGARNHETVDALTLTAAGTGLLTDRYELTMLAAALADSTADRRCTFEVFARRLPPGRRYGVVAGTARLIDAIEAFRFRPSDVAALLSSGVLTDRSADYLRDYDFTGDISGYAEGEPYFPGSPILSVTGTFAEAVLLETVVLSILNHDCAIAAGAARMVQAAGERPIIEMGSRRTHEHAAVASARAAHLAGFASTSNLAAGVLYGIPTAGTSAHAFTLVHDTEAAAFRAQLAALGMDTTLLVDTHDVAAGIDTAIEAAGTGLGGIRIDSGDLGMLARQSQEQLDRLGATRTKIVLTGDLDEFAIAALAASPVDVYGAGTAVVIGAGAPTAELVYKLVEVDQRPVAKRSEHKATRGGRKIAYRRHGESGVEITEIVLVEPTDFVPEPSDRPLTVALMLGGQRQPLASLPEARDHHRTCMQALPLEALRLSAGEPALSVDVEPVESAR